MSRKWEEKEVQLLLKYIGSGLNSSEIAYLLQRSVKSVDCKIEKLHLSKLQYKSKSIKPNNYSYNVKCPFFILLSNNKSKTKRLVCEGINPQCMLSLEFADEFSWKKHVTAYCNNDWEKCLIAKMLLEKYEE